MGYVSICNVYLCARVFSVHKSGFHTYSGHNYQHFADLWHNIFFNKVCYKDSTAHNATCDWLTFFPMIQLTLEAALTTFAENF